MAGFHCCAKTALQASGGGQLILNELFCASTVRIGDIVFRLKGDSDIHAETKTPSNGRKSYTLNNQVKYLGPVAADGKGGVN
ncbi:MAG: hypothetical protein ACJAVM_003020 [Sulfitobacter sp.]|jgi:hypothetical protein